MEPQIHKYSLSLHQMAVTESVRTEIREGQALAKQPYCKCKKSW